MEFNMKAFGIILYQSNIRLLMKSTYKFKVDKRGEYFSIFYEMGHRHRSDK